MTREFIDMALGLRRQDSQPLVSEKKALPQIPAVDTIKPRPQLDINEVMAAQSVYAGGNPTQPVMTPPPATPPKGWGRTS